jgi:rubrerythrin
MTVDDFPSLRARRSRRDFLRLTGMTAAGGSSLALAACGDDDEEAVEVGRRDVRLLNAALDLENVAIAVYSAGAALLEGEARRLGRQFLQHEKEHAARLSELIEDLGGTPHEPRSDEEYKQGFPKLRQQTDVLRFASDVENAAIAKYVEAIPKLSNAELRQTSAAIVSSEAEHRSVLLGLLGVPQVPNAFVTGTE